MIGAKNSNTEGFFNISDEIKVLICMLNDIEWIYT